MPFDRGGSRTVRDGGLAFLVGIALLLGAALAGAAPSSDGTGAFATGKYRNLFVEAGHTEAEVDAKIARAWKQLFEGDPETERLFTPSGRNENGPLAYIPDVQHADVRSEGMSYGMMIAVQLDRKAEFDALWNWSVTHMYQEDPKHPSYGFFSWQVAYDGTVMDELPAPDGEEYFVMALYFAANRWGNGQGIYDYEAHADRLLHDMVHREPITGMVRQRGGLRQHTVGREVNDEHGMILFSPDERNSFTDASYHLPAFYELWARWGPEEDRTFWARAATVSRDYFVKSAHPKTGLVPNLCQFDGTPLGFWGPESAAFREDAWRVAMNWSVDWSWWGKDPRQHELSDRLQGFFESQGMETYGDNWKLDGTMLRDRHSPGLVATNGVASLAATDGERARKFTEAFWSLDVPSSKVFRYYDGLLYLMSLLHASGRFQVIEPKPRAVNPRATREAQRLLDFLYEIQGKRTMSGNLTEPGTKPALTDLTPEAARERLVKNAIQAYRDGHIVTLMWHACPPGMGDVCDGRAIWTLEDRPSQQWWDELTTDGTKLNTAWKAQADVIAGYLKQLKDARVPVLWRPYHEMNGVWFWWCDKKGTNGFKKLWIMMYERYVTYHHLDNLIWVWNTNAPRDRPGDEAFAYEDFWPGREYVDVLAADVYRDDWKQSHHDDLRHLAQGKPIALGEVAPPPTPETLAAPPHWTWFMPWGNLVLWGNGPERIKTLFASDRILTRDQVTRGEDGVYRVRP